MKRRDMVFLPAVALGPLVAGGCSVLPQAADETVSLHLLDARPTLAARTRHDLVLALSTPRAAAGHDTAAMLYVRQPNVLEHYATHRWVDAPARLLQPLLMRTLEDAGGFRAVVPAGSGVQADLRLDTELVQLRQNFLVQPSRAELAVRLQLVDAAGRRVLATRVIEQTEVATTADAPGGVVAANVALARALAQVAAFCVEAAAALPARR